MDKMELQPLSGKDGHMVYRMLQKIPAHENGFYNGANGLTYEQYKAWLVRCEEISQGIGVTKETVQESIYWFLVNDIPVGIGKIRHQLTPALRQYGGSIAYSILESCRNKGYGTKLLQLLLIEANKLCIPELMLVIYNYNYASHRVAIKNGFVCYNRTNLRTYYSMDGFYNGGGARCREA